MKSEIESNDQAKKEKKKKIEDINSDIAKTQAKLDDITPKVWPKNIISDIVLTCGKIKDQKYQFGQENITPKVRSKVSTRQNSCEIGWYFVQGGGS